MAIGDDAVGRGHCWHSCCNRRCGRSRRCSNRRCKFVKPRIGLHAAGTSMCRRSRGRGCWARRWRSPGRRTGASHGSIASTNSGVTRISSSISLTSSSRLAERHADDRHVGDVRQAAICDSVRSCTRPARANVWPAFISTAVSTWRTVSAGTVKFWNHDAARIVDFADSRTNFEADIAVAEHDRQEVDLRAERLEFDRRRAQALRHDDRDFTADVELRRAAADGDDVRLGQDLGDVDFAASQSRKPKKALLPLTMPNSAALPPESVDRSGRRRLSLLVSLSRPLTPVREEAAAAAENRRSRCAMRRSLVREISMTLTLSRTCCTPPTVMLLITLGA